jgi:hypothetical protein
MCFLRCSLRDEFLTGTSMSVCLSTHSSGPRPRTTQRTEHPQAFSKRRSDPSGSTPMVLTPIFTFVASSHASHGLTSRDRSPRRFPSPRLCHQTSYTVTTLAPGFQKSIALPSLDFDISWLSPTQFGPARTCHTKQCHPGVGRSGPTPPTIFYPELTPNWACVCSQALSHHAYFV